MKQITVNTQAELDAIPIDFEGEINIAGIIDRINTHYPNAIVYVYGNAQVRNVYGNAQVSYVYDNAQVSYVSGNAQVSYVYDNAQVRNVYGNAQVSYVSGNAAILYCSGKASIQTQGQNIISYNKSETRLTINASPHTTIVVLDEMNANLEGYQKFYPIEVKNNAAILYKAVHKFDGKYLSDKNRTFEYKIGEAMTHDCDPSNNNSCSYGLHVSHKIWALKFGNSWSDMAILECSVPIDKIVVSTDCDGKVRTSELTVIREIPESEYYK